MAHHRHLTRIATVSAGTAAFAVLLGAGTAMAQEAQPDETAAASEDTTSAATAAESTATADDAEQAPAIDSDEAAAEHLWTNEDTTVYFSQNLPEDDYSGRNTQPATRNYGTTLTTFGDSDGNGVGDTEAVISTGDGLYEGNQYNAIGFNPDDGYIYAVSRNMVNTNQRATAEFEAGHLLKIDPDTGDVVDLGAITWVRSDGEEIVNNDSDINSTGNYMWAGSFADQGTGEFGYYVTEQRVSPKATGMTGEYLYSVDLKTQVATQIPVTFTNTDNVWGTNTAYLFGSDLAYNASTPGYLWGMGPLGTEIGIQRINLATGVVDTFNIDDLEGVDAIRRVDQNTGAAQAIGMGGAWTTSNGDVAFIENNTSGAIALRITNGTSANPTFTVLAVDKMTDFYRYNFDATSNWAPPKEDDGHIIWDLPERVQTIEFAAQAVEYAAQAEVAPVASVEAAQVSSTPRLANTGVSVQWMLLSAAGLTAAGALTVSRSRRRS